MPIIYEKQGAPKPPAANTPTDCNVCQYYDGEFVDVNTWDTERDARQVYKIWRNSAAEIVWAALWNNFICPPQGKDCRVKDPCAAAPTFLEGGSNTVLCPDGNVRFQIYLQLGREIRCVHQGPGVDVPPEIPEFVPYTAPQPGSGQPPSRLSTLSEGSILTLHFPTKLDFTINK